MTSSKELKTAPSSTQTSLGEKILQTLAEKLASYKEKRVRKGKTAKDHINGQKQKNQQNKDSRASWQNDSKGTSFPAASCNGKRNRYQVTGPKGETIFLKDAKRK